MNEDQIAKSVSDELDDLDVSLLEKVEIKDTINTFDNNQLLLYSTTNCNIIIPYFRTMSEANTVDSLM
jgi:hypothetical protein